MQAFWSGPQCKAGPLLLHSPADGSRPSFSNLIHDSHSKAEIDEKQSPQCTHYVETKGGGARVRQLLYTGLWSIRLNRFSQAGVGTDFPDVTSLDSCQLPNTQPCSWPEQTNQTPHVLGLGANALCFSRRPQSSSMQSCGPRER